MFAGALAKAGGEENVDPHACVTTVTPAFAAGSSLSVARIRL